MQKDDAACPSCQSTKLALKYALTDPRFHTARCRICGFVAMHPYPSDDFLETHYRARSLYNSEADNSAYARAVSDRAKLISDLLARAGKEGTAGTAVDFGAGAGIGVAAQMSLGFKSFGIEANPRAQAIGRELFNAEIVDLPLNEMPNDLDLFTMFEVLEHIKYPRDFLASVRAHMTPDGVIVGTVPNYNGLARYLRGKDSIALAWPEHVNQFTRKTLRKTLEGAGFRVIYIGFPPPYGVVFTLSLRARLLRRFGSGPAMRRVASAITWIKKYLAYPVPNMFAEKTGLLGHGLVFVGSAAT
jgi:SAM-dependent methyltransferase